MPVDLPKLGPRGPGVFGARTGPSLAATLRDADTAQAVLELEQNAAEGNLERIRKAIDVRREAAKLPAQKFTSSLQALHEFCRINRAQLDALVEERRLAQEKAEADKESINEVLTEVKRLSGAIDTADGGATAKEVESAVRTGCNLIHERLDRLDGKEGGISKGFAEMRKVLERPDSTGDLRGLLGELKSIAEATQREVKEAADSEGKILQTLVEEQEKLIKATGDIGTALHKIGEAQGDETKRATAADKAVADSIGDMGTALQKIGEAQGDETKRATAADNDAAKVSEDSAKKLDGIVDTTGQSLKKIGVVQEGVDDAVKHASKAATEASGGRQEVADSAKKISGKIGSVSSALESFRDSTEMGFAEVAVGVHDISVSVGGMHTIGSYTKTLLEDFKATAEKALAEGATAEGLSKVATTDDVRKAQVALEGGIDRIVSGQGKSATAEGLSEARRSFEEKIGNIGTTLEAVATTSGLADVQKSVEGKVETIGTSLTKARESIEEKISTTAISLDGKFESLATSSKLSELVDAQKSTTESTSTTLNKVAEITGGIARGVATSTQVDSLNGRFESVATSCKLAELADAQKATAERTATTLGQVAENTAGIVTKLGGVATATDLKNLAINSGKASQGLADTLERLQTALNLREEGIAKADVLENLRGQVESCATGKDLQDFVTKSAKASEELADDIKKIATTLNLREEEQGKADEQAQEKATAMQTMHEEEKPRADEKYRSALADAKTSNDQLLQRIAEINVDGKSLSDAHQELEMAKNGNAKLSGELKGRDITILALEGKLADAVTRSEKASAEHAEAMGFIKGRHSAQLEMAVAREKVALYDSLSLQHGTAMATAPTELTAAKKAAADQAESEISSAKAAKETAEQAAEDRARTEANTEISAVKTAAKAHEDENVLLKA
ncbi:hypothetical protein V502_10681 [Pseudogymnoascus sp. VKM F-4520 (FW-2644)]|nr:hypothetical protein V502_10681 [Pseudogymnoascus sp. VKM F-4520 (FW-2644)]